jgi:hypothetical protein
MRVKNHAKHWDRSIFDGIERGPIFGGKQPDSR